MIAVVLPVKMEGPASTESLLIPASARMATKVPIAKRSDAVMEAKPELSNAMIATPPTAMAALHRAPLSGAFYATKQKAIAPALPSAAMDSKQAMKRVMTAIPLMMMGVAPPARWKPPSPSIVRLLFTMLK